MIDAISAGDSPLTAREAESLHDDRLPYNLYVADASLLPRSMGNPPILTIIALAKRVSALASLILSGWFVVSLLRLPAYDRGTVVEWLGSPLAAVPMALLVITTFWHLKMGLIVVVEDYVHEEGGKLFWVTLINFLAILGAGLALFSILRIATTGSPA